MLGTRIVTNTDVYSGMGNKNSCKNGYLFEMFCLFLFLFFVVVVGKLYERGMKKKRKELL